MDSHQPPPPYRPPSGPPPPADPYHQYYQHPARPPVPPPTQPGGPAWYSNQFHHPHSPSPPPPPQSQWGQPSPHFPQGYPPYSHQPPFNAGANGNSQYPPANQEWENQNWGYHQGHASQVNSNVEDWAVKAREYAAAKENQNSPNPPTSQVYQQYHHNHGYQQFPGASSAGLPHEENLPTTSLNHPQEVPYSYSSVAGKEESGNEMQISVPDAGGPIHGEQQIQYAYGDQRPSNLSDQPLQFATRDNSDYASLHNSWPPHAATGVPYPPFSSSVPSIPQHDTSMAMPPVSGHAMPPFGRFPLPNNQPVGPPYAFGTKPPLHPVAAFMDDSYAASSVPPKKEPVPNWLKEELLKNKASLGRPSGSFEERDSMDDDVVHKPPTNVDQHDDKSFSPSKSSDEEEEEDEDEMDEARSAAVNLEIKRILTEVLLKVTDELFDEIATKVIEEDEALPKDNSVQHNHKSSSSLISAADPMQQASAKILVSVGGADKKAGSGSPADVLGLGSYASDDDDADAASNADADGSDGVESLGMGPRNDVNQQPKTEKLPEPEAVVTAKLDPEVEVGHMSPNNNKSGLDQMLGSRRNDDEGDSNKNLDTSASSGLDDAIPGSRANHPDICPPTTITGSRANHPDRTDSYKDTILDEPHRKNSGMNSDCNLRQDSNDSHGKDLSDDVSRDRSRRDETKGGKEKIDSQNGSKDRLKQNEIKSAETVKGFESNKKSTDLHVKKDSKDAERSHRGNSKEERGKKWEKEKQEERSRHRQAEDSSKDKRRRSPTSNGSSDDSSRKSRSRRRNISPSPVRSRRKRSCPSSDESSDDSRRKSTSRRRNRSPSPERSKRRNVSSRSPHSRHSQRKHTVHSSHDTSRSKRSRSRSPRRRHGA